MKTFSQFVAEAKKKIKVDVQRPIGYRIADVGPGKKEYNVVTSKNYPKEAYDADLMRSASVRTTGAGGRIAPERKKTAPEMRRMKQAKAGETRQPSQYKTRSDVGQQRGTQTAAPTQERGSAREAQLAAAKAERIKAAKARAAAKKGGGEAPAAAKPKPSELSAQARKLTTKKAPQVDHRPADQPKRPVVGMSRAERARITKAGQRKLRDLVLQSTGKKKESELQHRYTTW
jgi:hypothetical protein